MLFARTKAPTILFLSLSLLASIGASSAWAQGSTAEPQSGIVTPAGTVNVQDLPDVGPRLPILREMPFRVPNLQLLLDTKARHEAGTQPTPNASSTVTGSKLTTVSPTTGFIGLRQSESGGWRPPDTQVGVGPNSIVEAVNLELRIWDKSGNIIKTTDLNSFFGVSTTTNLSDPKIRFDSFSGRWFIAVISYNSSFTAGAWLLAVSGSSDPYPATFTIYQFPTNNSAPDFPALGVSSDKVVLTANAFHGNSFVGTEFLVYNKADLTVGTKPARYTYYSPPQGLFTIQPAQSLSPTSTLYMAAVAYNSATSIQLWSVDGAPGGSPPVSLSTKTLSINSLISPPGAQQYGTRQLITTNDNRLLDAVFSGGNLWVSANSACKPSGDAKTRACLRLMQFAIGSSITNTTRAQDFDFGQSGYYYYYPAIQIDGTGNLFSVFSSSSAKLYAGVYASGQRVTDPNTFQSPVLIKSGEGAYTTTRWGDYSGAAVDPSNSSMVWVAGEYTLPINSANQPEWGTWLAPLQMQ
ncbi:MAG: hypothetical protein KGJ27_07115 [candidate division NC10 bacterium]|nr:hypothetical protein [candidate division NC10 bacterium]